MGEERGRKRSELPSRRTPLWRTGTPAMGSSSDPKFAPLHLQVTVLAPPLHFTWSHLRLTLAGVEKGGDTQPPSISSD
jgi:hypothetical protein